MAGEKPGIKGNVLSARAAYVRARAGEPAWRKVLARLPAPDQKTLTGTLLAVSWYPLELALRLDEAIVAEFAPGQGRQMFIDMGRASAETNLAGAERVFVRAGDPQHLLKYSPQIYGFYYQVGRRTYERTAPNAGVVRTFDAESVTAADCLTVMGWHQRALELCGAIEVKVDHPVCRAESGDHCAYHFSWTGVLPGHRPPSKSGP